MRLTYLFLALLLVGCSERVIYQNQTIYINNTIIKEVPVEKVIPGPVQYIDKTDNSCQPKLTECEDRSSSMAKSLMGCLINLSMTNATENCDYKLEVCNDTLTDYTNRLNNITWISERNR